MNLPVIYAVVKPENHASIRVTERLGMKPIGRTNKYYNIELLLFQLDAPEEWRENRGAVLQQRVGGQRSGVQRLIAEYQRLVAEYQRLVAEYQRLVAEY
ncbi:GNAT family N-acetyltransferase [Nostoc sphaeroides CHAB 2801]|uniref:GNAT family protein n=1 Tax=Nostoc sphaeroides TaxID=446679 RepID=UPI001E5ECDF5|nr:GNAT family protein [Nostoc sphaeroides]MCC5630851.1 GNAT family N-acetyltransferase [Nostoc sphaeroides CHAB 2801]